MKPMTTPSKKSIWLLFLVGILFWSSTLCAQTLYQVGSNPVLQVDGTSNIRDWSMVSNTASGSAQLQVADGKLIGVQSGTLKFKAETMKSGTSGLDRHAYTALKTKAHPYIEFKALDIAARGGAWELSGELSISGTKQKVRFPVTVVPEGKGFRFKGEYDCKMTDFKIDPPTALMGAAKARDDIKIIFNVLFNSNN